MKINHKRILYLITFVTLMISCNKDEYSIEEIAGSWKYYKKELPDKTIDITYIFNLDGTGRYQETITRESSTFNTSHSYKYVSRRGSEFKYTLNGSLLYMELTSKESSLNEYGSVPYEYQKGGFTIYTYKFTERFKIYNDKLILYPMPEKDFTFIYTRKKEQND